MPKRTDIKKILIIGSGPIVIGQACEFDYSGTQACKALREQGYEVVLVNSNPATIMTDPDTADRTYIEPINGQRPWQQVIAKERPDALLPNLGGQTGLNLRRGAGPRRRPGQVRRGGHRRATSTAIETRRGPRAASRTAMNEHRHRDGQVRLAYTVEEAVAIADELGYPVRHPPRLHPGRHRRRHCLRPRRAAAQVCEQRPGLSPESPRCWSRSPSRAGRRSRWRSCATPPATASSSAPSRTSTPWASTPATPSCVAPMPDHLNDVRAPAPAQTTSIAILERVGVHAAAPTCSLPSTPRTAAIIVIEINPRASPLLGPGLQGHGLPHRQGGRPAGRGLHPGRDSERHARHATPACFEPSIDYCVVKDRRAWPSRSSRAPHDTLATQHEGRGRGHGHRHAPSRRPLQKAIRSLEHGPLRPGLADKCHELTLTRSSSRTWLATPTPSASPVRGRGPAPAALARRAASTS